MNAFSRIAVSVAAVATTLLAPSPGARAGESEDAPGLGASIEGFIAPVLDDSVTNLSGPQSRRDALVGFAALANFGHYAVGGVADGFPGIFGGGRLTVGGMAGWQPQVGGQRYQVLGELGGERFTDVGGNFFATPSTHETWLAYAGARLGASTTFGGGEHLELGGWLFIRKDLGEATVSNTSGGPLGGSSSTTDYRLGGYTAGVALRVGLRFDKPHR